MAERTRSVAGRPHADGRARPVVPLPGVRLADLARHVYARAGAGDPPDLAGDALLLAEGLGDSIFAGIEGLGAEDQATLVDTATTLVEQLYTHLPLKRERYAIDPLRRLRLLRTRCGVDPPAAIHRELADVFLRLRDAHTRYVGPASLAGCVAYLPFFVEEYGPAGGRRYVVSKVTRSAIPAGSSFSAGVEAVSWNGVPFARAVEVVADQFVGSHPDARRARGIESLTRRAIQYVPLPDEHWVVVGYRTPAGDEAEIRLDWRVFTPDDAQVDPPDPLPGAAALAIDHEGRAIQAANRDLVARRAGAGRARPAGTSGRRPAGASTEVPTRSDALTASVLDTGLGPIGHLRIWNFSVADHEAFVLEVRRVLRALPDRGLVIDIRSNPGGVIWAAERILQLLTPSPIAPARFSLPVTELTRALVRDDVAGADLLSWQTSIEEAKLTGEPYSQPIPLTDPRRANDLGQCYGGPVVCIADARSYSCGDLFAAGFVDNEIGPLITVGAATGGGGANVWTYALAQARLRSAGLLPATLPAGCSFTFSFRRATRAGDQEGRPIEDVGVAGTLRYDMTRRDLMSGNADLTATAVEVLAAQRFSRMNVTRARDRRSLGVRTAGIDAVSVTVDGTGTSTTEVESGRATIALPEHWETVEVEGLGAGRVLQRRRVQRA
jgi:hypothetical protein